MSDLQTELNAAVLTRLRRERERIINAIVAEFGLDRARVEDTVTGRLPGVLTEAKA